MMTRDYFTAGAAGAYIARYASMMSVVRSHGEHSPAYEGLLEEELARLADALGYDLVKRTDAAAQTDQVAA
jgi:hypothetical protein